ncbi:MAG: replication factor C large subunit [Candidatus Diapherotrites archaeon]|nr:replication factor C large subunit [Candidatus Diapherotrites archaeon]
MVELWTEKYAPKKWCDFIGNSQAVAQIKEWAESWQKGIPQKPIILHGPVGNGKTTLASLCAKEMGWQLFEMNASDFRTKELIEKFAGNAAQGASLFGSLRLILLDEVDGLQAQDKGGAEAIAKLIKDSKNPIMLTANDIYENKKLLPIRAGCEIIKMDRVAHPQIFALLKKICISEKLAFEEAALELLAKNSAGDIRAAILDLQTLSFSGHITVDTVKLLSYRERGQNIFNVMAMILKAKKIQEVRNSRVQSDVDDEMLIAWISENIPLQYDPIDTASAMNQLSLADVFDGRILKRQYYGLKRYVSDLATACAALSRSKEYRGWVKYQFPKFINELSKSSEQRAIKKSICKKIAVQINESAKSVAQNELPLIMLLFSDKKHAASLTALFGFDEKEVSFLLHDKKSDDVLKIIESAEEIKADLLKEKLPKLKKLKTK